ncbi:hypothetical protein [Sphingomonas aerophila]|uniref:Uncharacterized protein n=1 Tax=Sphingomonas aerophila TaxID=1344948 RepID=A0A7W9BHG6_9SPHN|nr:hypothetical protein [Sphingomonas aerophila]MBB5717044.1 hypothetical protein [Sphingomonas aerophila]
MKKFVVAALIAASLPGVAVAKKKQVSSLELQQIQSREFETSKDVAFAAVMTVLQDSGYRIGSADRDTGLITGAASSKTHMTWMPFVGIGKSKKTPVVSAYIEDRGPASARVRLNFVMTKNSANQFGGSADEEPIVEPTVYQDAFEKVGKELFVRQALKTAPAPVPGSAVVPTPVAAPVAAVPVVPVASPAAVNTVH